MLKLAAKRLLPGPLYRWLRGWLGTGPEAAHGTQAAAFYDRAFLQNAEARGHYTRSSYYMIWTVIIDRLLRNGPHAILEIGCGAGQLTHALHDAGILKDYCGFDFSPARIAQAKFNNPMLRFEIADAFTTGLYTQTRYDTVVCTEFLEHVEGDLEVLGRLPEGVRVIATVPNFPYVSHVRHFADKAAVSERYADLFDGFYVVSLRADAGNKTFYLFEGIKH